MNTSRATNENVKGKANRSTNQHIKGNCWSTVNDGRECSNEKKDNPTDLLGHEIGLGDETARSFGDLGPIEFVRLLDSRPINKSVSLAAIVVERVVASTYRYIRTSQCSEV